MSPDPRLSINQATIKHAKLEEALRVTAGAGIQSIELWREPVNEVGLDTAARMLADSGLRLSTHCRGGFFTLPEGPHRRAVLDDNRRAIEEAATLAAAGAEGSTAVLVLVASSPPQSDRDLIGARERVPDAIGALAPDAKAAGVIDFVSLTQAVIATGYDRDIEVEIFNADIWADAPENVVRRTAVAFGATVSPHLR